MGMFDYLRCEVPLPDGFTGELQTKDFERTMGEHVITKDGRLVLAILERVDGVPKAERPYPDADPGSFEELIGSTRPVWRHEDANYHGIVNFYGGEYVDSKYVWHEYNAKFTDGDLVEIVLVKTRMSTVVSARYLAFERGRRRFREGKVPPKKPPDEEWNGPLNDGQIEWLGYMLERALKLDHEERHREAVREYVERGIDLPPDLR